MEQIKSRYWSVTINNPNEQDEVEISRARQKGWQVDGQKEVGAEGTPHYQLIVDTRQQQRFSAVKRAFSRAHIEKAHSVAALTKYVHKTDTRVSELPVQQSQFLTPDKVWHHWSLFITEQKRQFPDSDIMDLATCLSTWDSYIRDMIKNGYYVELVGVNPQMRSAIKNYGYAIYQRESNPKPPTDRQTDRQTETDTSPRPNLFIDISHNNGENEDLEGDNEEATAAEA